MNEQISLVPANHPVLHQKASPVTDGAGRIAALLWQTLKKHSGVGLAAPQIGISKRVAVMNTQRLPRIVMVNPRIAARYGEQFESEEGCLSLPGVTRKVLRWWDVLVEAHDENHRAWHQHFVAYDAAVVQHEIDHLDGILITDRAVLAPTDSHP